MLDNEPEGGERTGTQPTESTPETTAGAPARRRTTRRRSTAAAAAEAAAAAAPAEAPTEARPGSDEAPQVEVHAPVAGDAESTPKTPRRRRKATTADKRNGAATEPAAGETAGAPTAGPDPGTEAPAEVAPPVKVTRVRRRKAASVTTGPESGQPTAGPEPAGTTTDRAGGPASPTGPEVPAAPGGTTVDEQAEPPAGRRRAVLSAPTVLFMAPEIAAPAPRARVTPAAVEPVAAEEEPDTEPAEASRRRRRGRRTTEPAEEPTTEAVAEEPAAEPGEEEGEEEEEVVTGRRRRRRGRRGRGRGKGSTDEPEDEETVTAAEVETPDEDVEETETGEGVTRRRRRRRPKGAGDTEPVVEDDGVPTVVKIREPRKTAVDEVQGVSGSTRLEAKRQRRRDGREQRRTRPPILTESEFLARREAVDRVMVIRQRADRTQIAVLEDGVLVEHYVSRASSGTMAGNVYLGKVQNVLPSMEAAFVDVGRGRNAVLYAGEVNWDTTGLEGRARSIEQALKSGDSVLVQVTKDPIGHKGARLTSHIALSGRHLVYVPNGNTSGISRKLPDTERKRLREVLKKLVPEGAGVIVRTAAEGASEEELARDIKRLQARWDDIQAKAARGGAPVLLYEEPDLVIRVVRDLFNEDFRELVVQGEEAYDMVESYLSHVSPDLVPRLRRHTGTVDVFAQFRIDEQILKGLDRKVYLPSGGHLVIDRTEAMTVVDVNTGKYTGAGGNLEETVTRNNLEAAEEIVRQLRLRDLGGIVVIDFIDMVLESNRELVLRRLTECLGRDRTKHQVTEITSLGLVQMTRKRIGAGLLEAFSETCEHCKGRGVIIHTELAAEKPRSGAGADKGRSAAAASTPVTAEGAAPVEPTQVEPAGGAVRRRSRRPAAERVVAEVSEGNDTMGYDLSRYETPTAETPGAPVTSETSTVMPETPAQTSEASTQTSETSAETSETLTQTPTGSMRLAGAGDPDAIGEDTDEEDGVLAGGRRRARRSGARRRTRP